MKIIEDIIISDSDIGDYSWIRVGSEIYNSNIGQDVFIGFKCRIVNTTIESNVQIASGCVFGENGKERVIIKKGSWLGADVVVKAGVTIGNGRMGIVSRYSIPLTLQSHVITILLLTSEVKRTF